ncbi:Nn.00g041470.m01.CDS01 [Neocucurbitaria sp. VM-36]
MPSTNLVIALIFAAIFGTALIWLTLYYVHRYIHQQCLELDHWFHLTALRGLEPQPCCYDKEPGRSIYSKSRSRSTRREKSRGRSQYEKARKRHEERSRGYPQAREMNIEWPGQRHTERVQPMLPTSGFMQNQRHEQQFYPLSGWHGKALDGGHMAYPQPLSYAQMDGEGAQVLPFAVPAAVPQQSFPPKATAMPKATHYQRRYQQSFTETSSDTPKASQSEKPPATPKSPLRQRPTVNKVDYIHVCDEYPPIVTEALKKAEEPLTSSPSSSSDTSATTQEVPRASIPRGTRRFADKQPLQFPQYSHIAARPWDVPTSYPRQWIDNHTDGRRGKVKSRYAPSMGFSGLGHITAVHRHQDPNFDISKAQRYDQQRQKLMNARRKSDAQSQPPKLGDGRRKSRARRGECKGLERRKEQQAEKAEGPKVGRSDGGQESVQQPLKEGAKEQSPILGQVPLYEPMPVPVIEEPSPLQQKSD